MRIYENMCNHIVIQCMFRTRGLNYQWKWFYELYTHKSVQYEEPVRGDDKIVRIVHSRMYNFLCVFNRLRIINYNLLRLSVFDQGVQAYYSWDKREQCACAWFQNAHQGTHTHFSKWLSPLEDYILKLKCNCVESTLKVVCKRYS